MKSRIPAHLGKVVATRGASSPVRPKERKAALKDAQAFYPGWREVSRSSWIVTLRSPKRSFRDWLRRKPVEVVILNVDRMGNVRRSD